MAPRTKPATEARIPLSRERVLDAAVAFADQNGIASLSMRKLGEALRVEAMSLYNYVANKEDLVDAMIDLVFGDRAAVVGTSLDCWLAPVGATVAPAVIRRAG